MPSSTTAFLSVVHRRAESPFPPWKMSLLLPEQHEDARFSLLGNVSSAGGGESVFPVSPVNQGRWSFVTNSHGYPRIRTLQEILFEFLSLRSQFHRTAPECRSRHSVTVDPRSKRM